MGHCYVLLRRPRPRLGLILLAGLIAMLGVKVMHGQGVPDLIIQKTADVNTATPNSTIVYTLDYTNTGSVTATGVVITEVVPANTQYLAGSSAASWNCASGITAGNICKISVDPLDAGLTASVKFAVSVLATVPASVTEIRNTASIGYDLTPPNNASTAVTPLVAAPDLVLTKSDGGVSVAPGHVLPYTLTYNNNGNQGATGVALNETVPLHTVFNASASTTGWSCSPNNGAGSSCTLSIAGEVAANGSSSAIFAVTVADPRPIGVTQISNAATISDDGANGADAQPGDNNASDTTPFTTPDLSITKRDGGLGATPGGTLLYTLTYTNTGDRKATGVELLDTVPANTKFKANSSPGWSCPNNNPGAVCKLTIGGLNPGESGSTVFAVTVANSVLAGIFQIANTASIQDDGANGSDPTPVNNSSSVSTPLIAAPDFVLDKDDGGITATPGGAIAYTLTYTNTGNRGAINAVITETVPANTTFDPLASTVGWVCLPNTSSGSVCHLPILLLNSGGKGSATFAVTVASSVSAGVSQIVNTASIGDNGLNGIDPTPANNNASETTPLNAAPDLSLTKSDGNLTATPGNPIVYTLHYANSGNQGATGVTLHETVPANTTFNAGSSTPGWACTPNSNAGSTCTLTIGGLAAGAQNSALFAVAVANSVPAGVTQIVNNASITDDAANGADPTPANNNASRTTLLSSAPKLLLSKRHDVSVAEPGKDILYTLTYTNTGNQDVAGLIITETVPAQTKFKASASTAGWSCVPSSGDPASVCQFTVGALAGGAHGSVSFAVSVANPVPAGISQINNTALLGDNRTPNAASATDVTPLTAAPDLSITKDDGGVKAKPGDTVVYQLNYTNYGNQAATGVVINEIVPNNTTFDASASTPGWNCIDRDCTYILGSLVSGASGALDFAVKVNSQLALGVGQVTNQATIDDDHSNGADLNPDDNLAIESTLLSVEFALIVTKQASLQQDADGNSAVSPGDTLDYLITLNNSGNSTVSNISFQDTPDANTHLAAGVPVQTTQGTVTSGNNAGDKGVAITIGSLAPGGMVQIHLRVTINTPLAPNITQVVNQGVVKSTELPDLLTDDADVGGDSDPTQTNVVTQVLLRAALRDYLLADADKDNKVSAGDTLLYGLTVSNIGNTDATDLLIDDAPDQNSTLVAGSLRSDRGTIVTGNALDENVQVHLVDGLRVGESVILSFQVKVNKGITATQLANQAFITAKKGNVKTTTPSDDPDTVALNDATLTPLGAFVPPPTGATLYLPLIRR